jgi:hypothetical protein
VEIEVDPPNIRAAFVKPNRRGPSTEDKETNSKYIYPRAPSPRSVTEVDGVEIVVTRVPMQYEPIEALLDELPEFIRETICKTWGLDDNN